MRMLERHGCAGHKGRVWVCEGIGGLDTETGLPEVVIEAKELLLAVLDTKVGYGCVRG